MQPDDLFDRLYEPPSLPPSGLISPTDHAFERRLAALAAPGGKLTRDRERELAAAIISDRERQGVVSRRHGARTAHMVTQDGREAVDELVTKNGPLATWFARTTMDVNREERLARGVQEHGGYIVQSLESLRGNTPDFSERVALGLEGLFRAALNYNGDVAFSVHAQYRMESLLLRAVNRRQSPITLHGEVISDIVAYRRTRNRLGLGVSEQPDSLGEIAGILEWDDDKTEGVAVLDTALRDVPFEALSGHLRQKAIDAAARDDPEDDRPVGIIDILPDTGRDMSIEEEVEASHALPQAIDAELARLPRQQARAVLLYHGFASRDGRKLTHQQVANQLGSGLSRHHASALTRAGIEGIQAHVSPDDEDNGPPPLLAQFSNFGSTNAAQGGRRPEVALDAADTFALGLRNPLPPTSLRKPST
jgi:hypothetical protein